MAHRLRMDTKLDYLQNEEPIEKQSALLVPADSARSRRLAFHELARSGAHDGAGARRGFKEAQATQFNQVESNPLDGSQIIRRQKRISNTKSNGNGNININNNHNYFYHPQHLDGLAQTSGSGEHLQEAAVPSEPLTGGQAGWPNLGPTIGQNRHPQPPDSPLEQPPQQCVLALTPTYAIVSSTISFYIPCIIMLALYTKLFACARKHVRNIQAFSKVPAPISAPTDTCLVGVEQLPGGVASSACEMQQQHGSFGAGAGYRATRTWLKLGRRRRPNAITTTTGGVPVSLAEPEAALRESRPFLAASHTGKPTQAHLHLMQATSLPHQHQHQQQQHQHQLQPPQQPPPSQGSQLATHKAAVTLGIIMGTFLFCWVPFFCLNIIKAFCVDCIPSSLFRAFTWLGYANSALNPIIYGIHNTEFRNAFSWIFFRHLNIKKNGSRLVGGPANNLNNNNLTGKQLSSSQHATHHRKRPTAFRQNSAPQSTLGSHNSKKPSPPMKHSDESQQIHLQLNQANNQCSTSPEL